MMAAPGVDIGAFAPQTRIIEKIQQGLAMKGHGGGSE
jgi:hypothetical protein